MSETLAFAGVTGGAGTTRLCVEVAATLARAGESVVVADAALDTQGLASYAEGRIERDAAAVLTDEAPVADALVGAWPDLPGRAALCPVHAPFERLARAKSAAAGERFATVIDRLSRQFDHVLVDVPPVGDNAAVAAVTSVDRRALVAPAGERGRERLPRIRGRLADLGTSADALVANCVAAENADPLPEADYVIPAGDRRAVPPTCADPDAEFAPAVAEAAEGLLDRSLDLEFPSEGLLG